MARLPVRITLWVLLVALLGAGGWLTYQLGISHLIADGLAKDALGGLRADWESKPKPERPGAQVHIAAGETFALVRIPKFGDDFEWPISSGESTLGWSLAWYPTSAQPGQVGNFALAGHSVGFGAPFGRLLELQVGDQVIVETIDMVYTYKIVVAPARLTVNSRDAWVLDPVPGKSGELPWEPIITLTTAQDLFPTADRSVAFGVLESKQEK